MCVCVCVLGDVWRVEGKKEGEWENRFWEAFRLLGYFVDVVIILEVGCLICVGAYLTIHL